MCGDRDGLLLSSDLLFGAVTAVERGNILFSCCVVAQVVKDPDKGDDNETLIPALESVVLEIDFEHKTMRVALPEGL